MTDFYAAWKGKRVVGWPGLERAWWRRADRNELPVLAVHETSALVPDMPEWDAIDVTWDELRVLPAPWRAALRQWRGVCRGVVAPEGSGGPTNSVELLEGIGFGVQGLVKRISHSPFHL